MPDTTTTGKKTPEPECHPAAIRFPDMEPKHFAELVEDIRLHGQQRPIITDLEGRIVDGLHRYRACLKLGIEPKFDRRALTDEEAQAISVSENLHRRHLTPGQWAAIAEENATRRRGGDQTANLQSGPTIAALATVVGVSPRSVNTVREVRKKAPELLPEIKAGKLAPHAAKKIADLPEGERENALKKFKDGGTKSRKSIAKDAASDESKTAPAKATAPTPSSAASRKKPPDTKRKAPFDGHGVYTTLFEELDQLPTYLDAHPLAGPSAQHLASKLRGAAERVEHSNKE